MKKIILLLAFIIVAVIGKSQMVIQTTTATSGTVTATDTRQDVYLVHDAGATLTLTIAFPSNPKDGQVFVIASANGITTLTLSSVVGTISNAITSFAAAGNATYIFSLINSKWYKIR